MNDGPKDEDQTLRAVDPGAVVEDARPLPEPSDGGVATLVGGERRPQEGQTRGEGEQDRDRGGDRWGPPRAQLDTATAALSALAFSIAFAAALAVFGLSLTPDRLLVVLLAPALVLRRARRYVLDFVPFAALILVYAELRGLAHVLRPHPYYLPHLDAEKLLFGGALPPAALQDWLWSGQLRWFDELVIDVTRIHSIVPPLVAFGLWLKRRALFYRFAVTILTLSFAAAVTFAAYPAAPPWAAAERGLTEPIPRLTKLEPRGGSSETPGVSEGAISEAIDPNPYAAIPSLHGGYAFLVFLFLATLAWRTRWRWLALAGVLYPLAQSFAAVYTGNHYVVDLVIGFAYAAAALFGVRWLWRRRGLPE